MIPQVSFKLWHSFSLREAFNWFSLLLFVALTEIFDDEDADDVPKMNMSNGTESQSDTDAHHIEYVYMLDEEKSQTTEQDVPSDLFDTIEMTEEDVDEQKKIEKPTKPDWADVESGIEIKSPVKMSQPEIVVPNKRRRSGSLLESSEESSTPPVLPQNETKNVTNPAMSHQKEPVTNTIAPVETTEMIVSTRSNTNPMESHDEETLFALSLVGQLKRLPPQKLAAAKCHILTYLMQLEYGNGNTQFSWPPKTWILLNCKFVDYKF